MKQDKKTGLVSDALVLFWGEISVQTGGGCVKKRDKSYEKRAKGRFL